MEEGFYILYSQYVRDQLSISPLGACGNGKASISFGCADEFLNGNICPGERYSDGLGYVSGL